MAALNVTSNMTAMTFQVVSKLTSMFSVFYPIVYAPLAVI